MAIYHELSFVQRMCWYPTSAVPVSTIMQPLICRKRFLFFAIQACQADTSRKKIGLYLLQIAYSRQGFGGGVFLTKNIFMIRSWTFPKKNFLRSLETAPGANSESEPSWFFLQSSESSPGPRFRILSSTSDSPDELSSILTYGTVSKYFKKKFFGKLQLRLEKEFFCQKPAPAPKAWFQITRYLLWEFFVQSAWSSIVHEFLRLSLGSQVITRWAASQADFEYISFDKEGHEL